jgi:molecular chaperone GrpE
MNENPTNEAETGEPSVAPEYNPLAEELSALKLKLGETEKSRDEALRTLAEYENSRKRAARDLEIERKFAHAKVVTDLLQAIDNLQRAIDVANQTGEKSALAIGVKATLFQFIDLLKRHGIEPIETQGQLFDPNLHNAVNMQPTDAAPPNTVLETLQRGFMIHDRVLRPATVIIAVAPTTN